MPSSVPAAMEGLRIYLASWQGLRPGDGVTVRSAPDGGDLPDDAVEFSGVLAPQGPATLTTRSESPTMTCWTQATAPGTDETAKHAARVRAYQLLGYVQAALKADPTAGGTVAPPRGTTVVAESALVQSVADLPAGGGRRAQVRFTISWVSHIT